MYFSKKILYSVIISLTWILTSCSDLTESPRSSQTIQILDSPDGFERTVNATYSTLRNWYGRERSHVLSTFGTDTWTVATVVSFFYANDYNSDLSPRDPQGVFQRVWSDHYKGINTANEVIEQAPNVDMDESVKTQRIAEVRFLRAMYYFRLVRMFGDVPLQLEISRNVLTEVTRAPIEAVYDAIIADLRFAIDNLPSHADQQFGRASQEASQHLLSEVFLTRGNQGDYQQAEQMAEAVINSGNFRLLNDYAELWIPGNERNEEAIFNVGYSANEIVNAQGNRSHLYFLAAYDEAPGMTRVKEIGRPWRRYKPTPFLARSFGKYDSRWEKSFKDFFLSNDEPSIPTDPNGEKLWALGDTAVWVPREQVSQEERDRRPPIVIRDIDEWNAINFPTLTKHLDPNRATVNDPSGIRDFQVFRLAETYLLAAEAEIRQGKLDEAATSLNVVRRRAAKVGFEDEMELTPSEVNIDTLLNEAGRELAGEMKRWFRLKRLDKLIERVRLYNERAAPNIQPFHRLRPIPQQEIDRATNELPQNPGY